jgi:hypothetical protein
MNTGTLLAIFRMALSAYRSFIFSYLQIGTQDNWVP